LDLNGGTLYTPSLTVADREAGGNAWLNWNGGTVVTTANTSTFVTLYGGSQNTYVGNGGAIINTFDGTTAHSITITPILKPATSSTGGLTKLGAGNLTLAGADTYIGTTTISAGTLALSSAGSIASTTNIAVAGGAIFDVSAKSGFTLGASQVLQGSGTNNGSVNTTSGTKVYAGGDATGTYATNTFNNNFTNVTGAAIYLDLGTVYNSSNDLISVGGTLALNNTVFHLKAPSTGVNLDTNDYLLMTAATISGSPNSAPAWDVSPVNAGSYTIQVTNSTNVVLHFISYTPPTAGITASVTNLKIGQPTTLTVTVTNGTSPTISSVTASASAIAGSPVSLVQSNLSNVYTNTVTIGGSATYGNQTLTATVTDGNSLHAFPNVNVFVHVTRNQVWNNGAATGNWNTSDANWTGSGWDNVSPDNAAFTTVGGVVSLTIPITAGSVNFGTTTANVPNATFTNGSLNAASLIVQGNSANGGSSSGYSYSSQPTLTVNVPTVSIAGDASVGRANLSITGGSFSANRIISAAGSGEWADTIISGGTVYVTNGVVGNVNAGATFQLDLNGGTLFTPSLTVADREAAQNGPAVLNWNGGTVVVTANTSTFVTLYGGSQNTYVGNGGAIINTFDGTTAHSVTITPNLLPATSSTGGLTKLGNGTLTLAGTNTYTGSTTISAGTLALGGSGSISNTPVINLAAGATFDVSAITAFALSGSNFLSAAGAASAATINGMSGGTVSLGAQPVTLTYDGTHPALSISQGTLILNGNAFTINSASPLTAGIYAIVSQASGSITSAGTLSVTGTAIPAGKPATISANAGNMLLTIGATTLNLITSSPTNGYLGSVIFTATVQTNGVAAGNATGTVQFETNEVAFGEAVSLTAGMASTSLNTLPRGTNLITAVYSGDGNYLGSMNALFQVVTNHPPVANINTYTRGELNSWKIMLSDLLTNASDVDGDTLTLAGLDASTNGITLVIITNAPGYVAYFNTNLVDDQFTYYVTDGYGGTNSAVITLTIGSTSVVGGQISGMAFTNGTASMTFAGIPGYKYNVQVSTNLNDWSTLWTTNAPGNGLFQFNDSSVPMPEAYYRLMWNGN